MIVHGATDGGLGTRGSDVTYSSAMVFGEFHFILECVRRLPAKSRRSPTSSSVSMGGREKAPRESEWKESGIHSSSIPDRCDRASGD